MCKPDHEKRGPVPFEKTAQKSADAQVIGGFYGLLDLIVSQSVHHVVEVRRAETGPLCDDIPGGGLHQIAFGADAIAVETREPCLRHNHAALRAKLHPAETLFVIAVAAAPSISQRPRSNCAVS